MFNLKAGNSFMKVSKSSVNIKLFLLVIAILISAATLFYTQNLVKKLQQRETQVVELYAKGLQYIAQSSPEKTQDFTFIFENIIKRIDFPLILTDSSNNPNIYQQGIGIKNIEIDSTLKPKEVENFLRKKIKELAAIHNPIRVVIQDSLVLNKIYYGNSTLVQQLKFYPFLQIIFAILFIIIAYVSFSYLKRTEQSNIWVGMAKETAHQLGTPISSLMGWEEILKMHYKDPDKVLDVAEEMGNDLTRLNKITKRFSKIGSKPELKLKNIYILIETVVRYYQRRIPQKGMNVELQLEGDPDIKAMVNPELFEWVLENLIKNALDAIGNNNGKIILQIKNHEHSVYIDVSDNGKGVDPKRRKDIFKPGFSTKKRGWGLGLSLSKRIIENYHKGKIFVNQSAINGGTTFRIILGK